MISSERPRIGFDAHAASYDADLARGLIVSGESKDYFARGRAVWLRACLRRLGESPRTALDFGCGVGSATLILRESLGLERVIATDASRASLHEALRRCSDDAIRFVHLDDFRPDASVDLAFCNGVFHHVPPDERRSALDLIYRSLRPGGLFAYWENNPWNPGTRWVMSRIPFDRDAFTLTPRESRRLISAGGFEIVHTTYQFVFPRFLSRLRSVERHAARLPIGAQYQVLCRRPAWI
ncbi:MAG: class I SAM-dependent methyltransferase [Vicinamibacteria bacterium]|nr:class I SAM-dependent methyltransferase [Vicinamibacteria bacterium]